jgi:hypothetical protein
MRMVDSLSKPAVFKIPAQFVSFVETHAARKDGTPVTYRDLKVVLEDKEMVTFSRFAEGADVVDATLGKPVTVEVRVLANRFERDRAMLEVLSVR